ncbi:MAG TPA: flagellar biosynthesis protein FlhA [Verrucomicrobia bacterium]|nr:flagellar biosynthesis protein FlhA [Verrucomicrobiota bacterium]
MSKQKFRHSDMLVAGAMIMTLAVLILPIPTPLLDVMLVLSIAMSALVLFIILQLKDALQLSSFPSLLLLLTLFRLALNVASTRQILLNGYAGEVIRSFGEFVIGGNYVVGVVVFVILVLVNFMVITKGAGRIAEVAARFTLDAMPGKQMSIDADLNAGLIDETTAVKRREALTSEADFYGAMDGASKFVRGDAVAGLVITFINIAGGFAIGMTQKGMSALESIQAYTILTVGDGLVSQIPALVISTAAGMLVTRAASDQSLGEDIKVQLFLRPKPLYATSAMLGAMALVPGLPLIPFMAMAGLMGGLGYTMRNVKHPADESTTAGAPGAAGGKALTGGAAAAGAKTGAAGKTTEVPDVSAMDVEIGFGLVPLVDRGQGGTLLDRITAIRQQVAEELGIILPPVNVHDNARLRNNEYALRVRGLEVARGMLQPGNWLAVDATGTLKFEGGVQVKEPTFGFRAWWVTPGQRELAESKGLTVVDAAGVLSTHLTETVRRHAAELLGRQDVSDMIERVKQKNGSVVQELIPTRLAVGVVHRVLQYLLRERVSIRDLVLILESLSDHAAKTQDPVLLGELCRRALGGHLSVPYLEAGNRLPAIALHPEVEAAIKNSISRENGDLGVLALPPDQVQAILSSVSTMVEAARKKGRHPVIVALPVLRRHIRRLIESQERDLAVLSFAEIPDSVDIDIIGLIKVAQVATNK